MHRRRSLLHSALASPLPPVPPRDAASFLGPSGPPQPTGGTSSSSTLSAPSAHAVASSAKAAGKLLAALDDAVLARSFDAPNHRDSHHPHHRGHHPLGAASLGPSPFSWSDGTASPWSSEILGSSSPPPVAPGAIPHTIHPTAPFLLPVSGGQQRPPSRLSVTSPLPPISEGAQQLGGLAGWQQQSTHPLPSTSKEHSSQRARVGAVAAGDGGASPNPPPPARQYKPVLPSSIFARSESLAGLPPQLDGGDGSGSLAGSRPSSAGLSDSDLITAPTAQAATAVPDSINR